MENKIETLIGQKVTKSSSGGSAGSILIIEFSNSSYFVIWCSWRVESALKVLVTSSDTVLPTENNHSPNGFIGDNISLLIGKKVTSVNLKSFYDLEIVFDREYTLRVFCDIGVSRDDYGINWELNLPLENISIEINNYFEMKKIEEEFE
ncbi:hypothetical protein K7P65_002524 [Enterococcus faecalis]|uniref:hypothetical protein n=1 Tax=Enterococcus faecalis TaxID=1351 RepID=UPI00115D576F|nr:hypothetical protein [Enterococcus faecalis]EGO5829924.1 hypothetical protein [Enterococcus faecalis]EGO6036231.1 hypothetical protein [Enterococcus faecalis]EGO8155044.1 hypothetical protein [Enterococcus faecalis]EGO8859129.1 hypothetical protein [Enterococcus faecalis]EHH1655716.1 hypothetical protein [Enterococcus faecalis]